MTTMKPRIRGSQQQTIAPILSLLVPGLGQMYLGEWKRGLALFIGLPAQAALFYAADKPTANISALIPWLVLVWLWNIWDASQIARGYPTSATAPAIIIVALNLFAAGKVTDVKVPQMDPVRRGVIGRIISGLASPDVVTKKAQEQSATAKYTVPGPTVSLSTPTEPAKTSGPVISLTPIEAEKGQVIKVQGRNFAANQKGELIIIGSSDEKAADFITDRTGKFSAAFSNPRDIPGRYFIKAAVSKYTGGWAFSETLRDAAPKMVETIYLALIGTAISLLFAFPLSFLGARNLMSGPGKILYGFTRSLFSVLRSVEVLIIVMVAAAAVGFGPFAGVLALSIHGIGALGKLYSEAIESIEHGPIEAIRATGASDLQVVIYGVVPQIVPQFIAFTLYRWDINVRMATVIGLVGGGGIGATLMNYMNLLQWRQAAAALWMIVIVVMLMDYASAVVREKLV